MANEQIWLGDTLCPARCEPVEGGFVSRDGGLYARIDPVDRLDPFLVSVVSASDVWIFAGSHGAFTAGRVDPDGGLFPYQTADKLLRHADASGATSIFLVRRGGRLSLWEPWRESGRAYGIRRCLYKHVHGTSLVYEEANEDLGLSFSWEISACQSYGLVRRCRLENTGTESVEVRYLDGWSHLIPPGVSRGTYADLSYLAAGYMRHEIAPSAPLGVFTMNAAMTDRPDPSESLRAAAAWTLGHAAPVLLLSERQVEAFRRGEPVHPEAEVRGEFGAFLAAGTVALGPSESHAWIHVADTRLDHAALVRLQDALSDPEGLANDLQRRIADDHEALCRLVAGADGLQQSADTPAGVHHFANVLINAMRGGTFRDGYAFPREDFASFLQSRSRSLLARHADWLRALPATMTLQDLRREAENAGDPQMARLAGEYLPLTFSRRHGDPSRPWNFFSIHLSDASGSPVHGYQGNWRDIFQNWEALAESFPEALESMVAVFLNASTADGYNPYRITREGIDWETQAPGAAWGNIGYWGDHQIVYLLRLLESLERHQPGRLAESLRAERFAYACVPYEIAGFDALCADPRHTITFNHDLHAHLLAREREEGGDGKLLRDADGDVRLVTLAEKLLVPLLAKLGNLVPEGGIWLNAQRPEWNDANNALAGWGLSVVTVQYIRRYLAFLDRLLASAGDAPVRLSAPVMHLLEQTAAILERAREDAARGFDDASRFRVLAALGRAGAEYRATLYRDGLDGFAEVPLSALRALVAAALPVIDGTIRANRRADSLFHSYNTLHLAEGGRAAVRPLSLMLEGQVAALSSGLLSPEEALGVLRSVRASDLYCPRRNSYLLYPDQELTPFLGRNTLPDDAARRAPLLADLVAAGDISVIVADARGAWHFQADLHNAADLSERLDRLPAPFRGAVERDRAAVLDLWEEVFRHSEFTGRSGTFFMFEGLGSIYWHMVAKFLLSAQECWRGAARSGADLSVVEGLAEAYDSVRDGLGFRKTPDAYGAFPTDPYSHTPAHRGAQQPGMTGQVKEEVLTRWGELGVEVEAGRVRFAPALLHRSELSPAPQCFAFVNARGEAETWDLPENSLAFTYCQVPVCYRLADAPGLTLERTGGRAEPRPDTALDAADSAALFARNSDIRRITVSVPPGSLRP